MAALLAVAGGLAVLLGPPSGTDLAAQQARAAFAASHPGAAVDLSWYGGVQPLAYSVLSPYLTAAVGVRLAGVLAAVAGAVLAARLLLRWGAPRAGWAAAWTAVVLVLDVVSGRTTFALGLTVGLAALVAVPESSRGSRLRWVLAVLLAAACALTSPVAAAFLALVAAGWALHRRAVAWLAVAAVVPLGVVRLLAPEPGRMPFSLGSALPVLAAAVGVVALCRGRAVRAVAAVYAVAVLVCYLVPGPVGSNIERLALLFTGPVLLCCSWLPRLPLVAALVGVAVWTSLVPVGDLRAAGGIPAERAAAQRLVPLLHALGPVTGRVEVVPFKDHTEADVVARSLPLARGWERQVDIERSAAVYDGPLTPERYLGWLHARAVQYVALADVPLDWSAKHESALLRSPPPYLLPVHHDATWTVWRVVGARPVVGPPGRLVGQDRAALRIAVPARTPVAVDVQPSHWWRVSGGACLARTATGVLVRAPRAETVTLSSSYADPAGGPACG